MTIETARQGAKKLPSPNQWRWEQHIAVSKDTLASLTEQKRGGEAFDRLLRRFLVSTDPKTLTQMSDDERNWVTYSHRQEGA